MPSESLPCLRESPGDRRLVGAGSVGRPTDHMHTHATRTALKPQRRAVDEWGGMEVQTTFAENRRPPP